MTTRPPHPPSASSPAAASLATPLSLAVERHYEELKAFLIRRLGSASAADDIIQDLWLRVAKDVASDNGPRSGTPGGTHGEPPGGTPSAPEARDTPTHPDNRDDEPIRNARAYLYRVAANLATDRLRQEKRRHAVISGEPIPEQIQDRQPLADQIVSGRQEFALLQDTIRALPEKCRAAFLLYRGENLTMQQVADRLGISPKTVEKHIAKAMLACRNRLRALRDP